MKISPGRGQWRGRRHPCKGTVGTNRWSQKADPHVQEMIVLSLAADTESHGRGECKRCGLERRNWEYHAEESGIYSI